MAADLIQAALLYRRQPERTFPVPEGDASIGFDARSTVRVPFQGVSRRHARITFDGKDYWIEDAGSANGTFLNGVRLARKERLRHLDVVTLGRRTDLIFVRKTMDSSRIKRRGIATAHLETLDGPETGRRDEIPRGAITIGRAPSNNVVAESQLISKIHARLERSGLQLVLIDLQSANGTFVEGKRVTSHVLRDGEVFNLGHGRSYRVRLDEGDVITHDVALTAGRDASVAELPIDWKTRIEWTPEEKAVFDRAVAGPKRTFAQLPAQPTRVSSVSEEAARKGPAGAPRAAAPDKKRADAAAGKPARPPAKPTPPAAPPAAASPPKRPEAPAAKPPAAPEPVAALPAQPEAAASPPPAQAKPEAPPAPPPAQQKAAAPPAPTPAAPVPPPVKAAPSVAPAEAKRAEPPASPTAPAASGPPVAKAPTAPPPAKAPVVAPPPAPVPEPASPSRRPGAEPTRPQPSVSLPGSSILPPVDQQLTRPLEPKPAGLARVVLEGTSARFSLEPGDHEIGRVPGMSVQLEASGISRRHALLRVTEREAVLEDLGSKNGTYVNGERIAAPRRLVDGDRLAFGEAKLRVRFQVSG